MGVCYHICYGFGGETIQIPPQLRIRLHPNKPSQAETAQTAPNLPQKLTEQHSTPCRAGCFRSWPRGWQAAEPAPPCQRGPQIQNPKCECVLLSHCHQVKCKLILSWYLLYISTYYLFILISRFSQNSIINAHVMTNTLHPSSLF